MTANHGTRSYYFYRGCRCSKCRAANARYQCERRRVDWPRKVSAASARTHILNLSREGVGRRAVADAASLSERTVGNIRSGRVTTIFGKTEKAILAVTADALANNALVSAKPTQTKIKQLIRAGFTKKELARRLGSVARSPILQINHKRVTARNAMKVEKFYRKIMMV